MFISIRDDGRYHFLWKARNKKYFITWVCVYLVFFIPFQHANRLVQEFSVPFWSCLDATAMWLGPIIWVFPIWKSFRQEGPHRCTLKVISYAFLFCYHIWVPELWRQRWLHGDLVISSLPMIPASNCYWGKVMSLLSQAIYEGNSSDYREYHFVDWCEFFFLLFKGLLLP